MTPKNSYHDNIVYQKGVLLLTKEHLDYLKDQDIHMKPMKKLDELEDIVI